MQKIQRISMLVVLTLAVLSCGPDPRGVAILKADGTLTLPEDVITIDLGQNSAGIPFVLKSAATNPPAGVSISKYSWAVQLNANAGGCPSGSSKQEIATQTNLSWVIGWPNTQYGGCFVQGSMTGTLSVAVTYSDNRLISSSVKVQFSAPPN